MIPLGIMRPGESGVITEIKEEALKELENFSKGYFGCPGGGCLFCKRESLEEKRAPAEIKPGLKVLVKRNEPGEPLLVLLNGKELLVDRGLAMKILVKTYKKGGGDL